MLALVSEGAAYTVWWISLGIGVVVILVGAVLLEQHEEWQVGRRYFSAASLAKLQQEVTGGAPTLLAAD